ncbi:MAG TPA: phage recombination protein Bet [Phycisphaerales bacterium]|nr:phage recombination protein Bet [Phycisphaerales bacterium]
MTTTPANHALALAGSTDAQRIAQQLALMGVPGVEPVLLDTLKNQIGQKLLWEDLMVLMIHAKRLGLDPLTKQIYAVPRGNGDKRKLTIQTGIDGFRTTADRSPKYKGQTPPQWCGEDGVWRDVWTSDQPPTAARVGVYKAGCKDPFWGVALWYEYSVQYQNDRGQWELEYQWQKRGVHMLAKCAEALAIRKAFPTDLSGIFTDDEMRKADAEEDGRQNVTPTKTTPKNIVADAGPVRETEPAATVRTRTLKICSITPWPNSAEGKPWKLEYSPREPGDRDLYAFSASHMAVAEQAIRDGLMVELSTVTDTRLNRLKVDRIALVEARDGTPDGQRVVREAV